jgi:hypothetical protein
MSVCDASVDMWMCLTGAAPAYYYMCDVRPACVKVVSGDHAAYASGAKPLCRALNTCCWSMVW